MKALAAVAGMMLAIAIPEAASSASQPIIIGNLHVVRSDALNEERTLSVVLPPGYSKETTKRYPVLYLIDGGVEQDLLHVAGVAQLGAMWGRSADAIIVGIETKDRRRELVGPTADPELKAKYPTAGQSSAFRDFIAKEVKPMIEREYRTTGTDAVIGESLAGLFVVETYMVQPTLFDGYAAIDPSLWWDKEALSQTAAIKIGEEQKGRALYLAIAKEQAEQPAAMVRIVTRLGAVAQEGWCLAERTDLTHATIYQQLTPQALQFLLPPAEPAPAEFGFEVKCSRKS